MVRLYVKSAGIIFITAAIAKMLSASGGGKFFSTINDLLPFVTNQTLYLVVGSLELAVGGWLLFKSAHGTSIPIVMTVSTLFVLYRFGLWLVGSEQPCSCFGYFGNVSGLGRETLESVSKFILTYLMLGSFWLTCSQFRWRRSPSVQWTHTSDNPPVL